MIDDSEVSTGISISSQSKSLNHDKEPFCSSFRPSLSLQPSHMTFNQKTPEPTLKPCRLLVPYSDEEDEDSTMKSVKEADDKNYSMSDGEDSAEHENEAFDQKCSWMDAHVLGCVVCKPVDTSTGKTGSIEFRSRSLSKKKRFDCPKCEKNSGQKGK